MMVGARVWFSFGAVFGSIFSKGHSLGCLLSASQERVVAGRYGGAMTGLPVGGVGFWKQCTWRAKCDVGGCCVQHVDDHPFSL